MRFARQSAIFRGPMDPAAVVSVLFLLVIFMVVGSLLYTPGVMIKISDSAPPGAPIITVTGDNEIIFAGKTNQSTNLDQLRADLKTAPKDLPFALNVESGANPKVVEAVRQLFQIQLPTNDAVNLAGTDNPTVVVAINFRGQCFFENRPIEERELKKELHSRLEAAAHASQKLTLVLEADKATENEAMMRIYRLAREAGITEFIQAEVAAPGRLRP